MPARRIRLRFGLIETGDCLIQRCHIGVIGGLLGVVILLCHDSCLIEALRPLPIQFLLFEVGLGMLYVSLPGLFRGNIGGNVGFRSSDGGLLGVYVCLGLHVLDGRNDLPFLNVIAFLHIKVRNAPE